jgi:hypothetical protein
MKLNLSTFKCDFDVATVNVAVMHLTNLTEFLNNLCLEMQDFKPDFINAQHTQFIFWTDTKEWQDFVNKIYAKTGTRVCLHDIPTPNDFDIIHYKNCTDDDISYIFELELFFMSDELEFPF